jgi:nickel-type superoxide dismutase maturation protease
MLPVLEPGDRLLVRHTRRPRRGDLVALRDPRQHGRVLVKRVAALRDEGVVVLGDNAEASTDSRTFGPVSRTALIGVAFYRYAPITRSSRLRRGPVRCTQWPPTSTPSSLPTTSKD